MNSDLNKKRQAGCGLRDWPRLGARSGIERTEGRLAKISGARPRHDVREARRMPSVSQPAIEGCRCGRIPMHVRPMGCVRIVVTRRADASEDASVFEPVLRRKSQCSTCERSSYRSKD